MLSRYWCAIVSSPFTLAISNSSNLLDQRAMVAPSNSGKTTSIGKMAITSSRTRTDEIHAGQRRSGSSVRLSVIPHRAFAVDRLARYPQTARGLGPVVSALLDNFQDVLAFDRLKSVVIRFGVSLGRAFESGHELTQNK